MASGGEAKSASTQTRIDQGEGVKFPRAVKYQAQENLKQLFKQPRGNSQHTEEAVIFKTH